MWLVDGRARKVEIHRAQEGRFLLAQTLAAGDMIETPLIPGLVLDVREIFEA